MSVAGMHALQLLLELSEKDLLKADLAKEADNTERVIGECFGMIGKGMLAVAQQTVNPNSHGDYVELHNMEVPRYPSQDNLFPNRNGEVAGQSRQLISFDVPVLRRHACDKGEHQSLVEMFGEDGWWIQGIVIDVIDFRGDDQRVNAHLMMADTRRNPRYNRPFPDVVPVLNYVYLTLCSDGRHYCERFSIGCNVDNLRMASMGRKQPEHSFVRPLNSQTTDSIDEVMGRGSEVQLLHDLPRIGAFLSWFAQDNARS